MGISFFALFTKNALLGFASLAALVVTRIDAIWRVARASSSIEASSMMARPERRDVVPSRDGKLWMVTKPGRRKPVSHHSTQADAEKAAKQDIGPGGGEIVIHVKAGSVREKDVVLPATDPYPPKKKS